MAATSDEVWAERGIARPDPQPADTEAWHLCPAFFVFTFEERGS